MTQRAIALRGPLAALAVLTLCGGTSAAAQGPLSLRDAISVAQRDGAQGKRAELARQADQYTYRSFSASLRPQISLFTTVPSYSSTIQAVTQPDGSTAYRSVTQTSVNAAVDIDQRLPMTGGQLRFRSYLNRLNVDRSGLSDELWNSTPFNISLSQPIFQPNPLKWQQKREAVNIGMSDKTYLAEREIIAVTTTNQFFDVYIARLTLQNAVANAATNDTLVMRNQAMEEAGKIGATDLFASQLQATQANQRVSDARLALDRASAVLRIALHLPPGAPLDLQMSLDVPAPFEVDTARATSEAIRNLPALDQVEIQRLLAEQSVSNAKLTNNINASLVAAYGYNASGDGFRNTYSDLGQSKQFTLGVTLPLMTFGQRKYEVRAAEAAREQVETSAGATIEQVKMEAHFAALELGQRRAALISSAKADTLARAQFEVEYSRYVAGRSTSPDFMYSAQDRMNGAYSNYLSALRSYWVAYYNLRQRTLYDFERNEPIR